MGQQAIAHVDHVGSLLRPQELIDAWLANEQGVLPDGDLEALQARLIREVVALQEGLGLAVVTDGEFRRGSWGQGIAAACSGLARDQTPDLVFQGEDGTTNPAPAPYAIDKVRRIKPIVADDFRFLSTVTTGTAKVTMPTPSHFHFGFFEKSFPEKIYPTLEDFFGDLAAIYRAELADLAEAGARYVQLDEVPLALCCDPRLRTLAQAHGYDPDGLVDSYIAAINQAVAGRPATMKIALHLCRGNQTGRWMGDGGYQPIADKLFNQADVDAYLMEYDSPRAGDFAPLKYLPDGKTAFLGLISTKNTALEPVDDLRRRLDEAARFAPMDRLGLCPQCGFGSTGIGKFTNRANPMTPDLQKAKLSRLVETAEAVW